MWKKKGGKSSFCFRCKSNSISDLLLPLSRDLAPHFSHRSLLSPPAEMLESSNLVTFDGLANSSSYDTFLLDEERGRLLVGAEDHLFSFDLVNINRDKKQVRLREEMPRQRAVIRAPLFAPLLRLSVSARNCVTPPPRG